MISLLISVIRYLLFQCVQETTCQTYRSCQSEFQLVIQYCSYKKKVISREK